MHSFRVKSTAVLAAMLSFLPTLVLADALPAGPYQLRDATFIVVGATFDAEAVRIALPKNLEPTDNVTGGINLYIAPEGWGLAPFSAGYIWVDVKGHDTASGPARYQVAAFYSDKAFELLKDLGTVEGTTSEEETEGVVTATGSIGGEPAITLSLRPSSSQCAPEAGVHNYVAPPGADGAATFMFVVPYAYQRCTAEVVAVELSPALMAFRPTSTPWAEYDTDGAIVLGPTAPLEAPAN